jgi:hypothetical protein
VLMTPGPKSRTPCVCLRPDRCQLSFIDRDEGDIAKVGVHGVRIGAVFAACGKGHQGVRAAHAGIECTNPVRNPLFICGSGNWIFTEVLNNSADTIPGEVGGNRYGWFTNIDIAGGIAVDNVELFGF